MAAPFYINLGIDYIDGVYIIYDLGKFWNISQALVVLTIHERVGLVCALVIGDNHTASILTVQYKRIQQYAYLMV